MSLCLLAGYCPVADIASVVHAVPADFIDQCIGIFLCLGDSRAKSDRAQHASAVERRSVAAKSARPNCFVAYHSDRCLHADRVARAEAITGAGAEAY